MERSFQEWDIVGNSSDMIMKDIVWESELSVLDNVTTGVWRNETLDNETRGAWRNETVQLFFFPISFQVTIHILYNFVFILGVLGNLLVCYVILCTSATNMKTVTNCFLFNLALGDLLILIFCLPLGYLTLLYQYWPFGEFLCYTTAPVKAIAVFVSSYTLIALTVDRYMTIMNPLKPRLRLRQNILIVILIWVAAIITAIPIGVFTLVEIHEESGLPRCGEFGWKSQSEELTYNLVLMTLQYFFPVVVLTYCYTVICTTVWGNSGSQLPRRNLSGIQTNSESSFSNGKRKTVVMSLLLTTGFAVAWLPYTLIYLVTVHFVEATEEEWFPYLYVLCHWLAMANSLYNPVIYVWSNSRFRSAFRDILYRRCCSPPVTSRKSWPWSSSWKSGSSTRNPHPDMDKNSLKKLMEGNCTKHNMSAGDKQASVHCQYKRTRFSSQCSNVDSI